MFFNKESGTPVKKIYTVGKKKIKDFLDIQHTVNILFSTRNQFQNLFNRHA